MSLSNNRKRNALIAFPLFLIFYLLVRYLFGLFLVTVTPVSCTPEGPCAQRPEWVDLVAFLSNLTLMILAVLSIIVSVHGCVLLVKEKRNNKSTLLNKQ